VPGAGQIHNGYATLGIMTDLQIASTAAMGALLFSFASSEREEADVTLSGSPSQWDYIDKYASEQIADGYTFMGSFMVGYAGLVYLYSILDSYLGADDPFVQVQYGHARVYLYSAEQTPNALFTTSQQLTSFNKAVSDMSGGAGGGALSLGYTASRSDMMLDLAIGTDAMLIGFEGHCQVPVWAGLSVDAGVMFTGNVSEPSDGTDEEDPMATVSVFMAPTFGLSYHSPRVAARVALSPWPRATTNMFVIENPDDQWWETTTMAMTDGFYLKGAVDVFFGSRAGLSAAFAYMSLTGGSKDLKDLGISTATERRDIFIRFGPVFRF